MITKHGSRVVNKGIPRLSTTKSDPEILGIRTFLKGNPSTKRSVAIKKKSVFIPWGGGMYEREDKHIIHDDGREEWVKKESYSDSGLITFFMACIAISLSITTCYLIVSGAKNNNEAKNFGGRASTVQQPASNMREDKRSGY